MTEVDLSWFVPLPKQAEFLQNVDRESIYAGGFGSGKTLVGGFRTLGYLLTYPGTQFLVGRQTYRSLRDTTQKVLMDGDDKPPVIPPELVKTYNKSDKEVTLHNGSSILFRSFDEMEMTKLRSLNLGGFWLDECSESTAMIWTELKGRLRRPDSPRVGFGTTNPNGHDWVWNRFHPDAGETKGALFIAPSTENIHLAPDYLDDLKDLPPELRKRFLYASFDTATGQIFDEWTPTIHVVPTFDVPETWGFVEIIDYGERNPTAWLLGRVDNDGNLWWTDEYEEANLRTSVHIEAIKAKRAMAGCDPKAAIICDPSMFATRLEGISPADEYRKAGIKLRGGVNNRSVTYSRVGEYMHPRDEDEFPGFHPMAGQKGAPRMFVMERCKNLRREIPEYLWKDLSSAIAQNRDAPEEPRKINDHLVDCMRYGCADMPKIKPDRKFTEPPKPERRKAQTAGVRTRTF